MKWNHLYGLRSYVRSSLWVVPFIAMPFEILISRLLHWIDAWLGWTLMGFAVPGAQVLLQTIVTATLSFVVFTFGSLLVAIQVASACCEQSAKVICVPTNYLTRPGDCV
jgi:Predicted membrane protein (DUF2254)